MPLKPKKCIGPNVKLTPTKVVQKCNLEKESLSFKFMKKILWVVSVEYKWILLDKIMPIQ